jgi:hypothetical protein
VPIDASIPLGFRPPRIDSPLEMMQGVASLQEARDRSIKLQRDRMEDEQIRQVLQMTGGDIGKALPQIRRINPLTAAKIEKTHTDSLSAAQDLENGKIDHDLKVLDFVGRQLSGVTDQRSYDFARAAIKGGVGQDLPPAYDPAVVDGWKQKGLTLAQQAQEKRQALLDTIAAQKEARDAANVAEDNRRQAEAAAETRRQNAFQNTIAVAQLGVSRGNLAVSQGHLKVSQDEAAKKALPEVAKLPAAIAEKVAGIEQSLSVLQDLERLKKDDWLGPIAGRVTQARIDVPGMAVAPDLARFAAQTSTLKNAVVKAITGAQMSEPEAKRIMQQIPGLTDKPEVWTERLNTTRENLTLLRRRMLELSGVSSGTAPTTTAAPTPATPSGGGKRFEIVSVK